MFLQIQNRSSSSFLRNTATLPSALSCCYAFSKIKIPQLLLHFEMGLKGFSEAIRTWGVWANTPINGYRKDGKTRDMDHEFWDWFLCQGANHSNECFFFKRSDMHWTGALLDP